MRLFPPGWNADKCLIASVGRKALPELEHWEYTPQIRAVPQLPHFKTLPPEHSTLVHSPWFQSPSQATGIGINARHLRYHHQLWNELRPKTLRGVHTTLVYVTPQLGYSLTPHIRLDKAFNYFAALSRWAGPVQLFPANYLYPDAQLGPWQRAPAPIFADLLPYVGGSNFPLIDGTPDPWGKIARFEGPDYFYGYPFNAIANPVADATFQQRILGSTILPNGQLTQARSSETCAYATLDPELNRVLKLDREAFQEVYCLGPAGLQLLRGGTLWLRSASEAEGFGHYQLRGAAPGLGRVWQEGQDRQAGRQSDGAEPGPVCLR